MLWRSAVMNEAPGNMLVQAFLVDVLSLLLDEYLGWSRWVRGSAAFAAWDAIAPSPVPGSREALLLHLPPSALSC